MYDVVNVPDLVIRYFSSTPWLIAFIVSTIYLFIRLNTAGKRAMLAVVVAFFLIINPFVIDLFTRLDQNSTYYRNLWAIPSIVIIGIAVVDLIRILPRWILRIPVVFLFAVLLWHINAQEYIRCRSQELSKAGVLVQSDVVELGDGLEKLRNETGKNRVFLISPVGYEIAYGNMKSELNLYCGFLNISDSSVLDTDGHNGETELTGENPDVEYIMSTCCSKGMDYVIASNQEGNKDAFQRKGYEPILETDRFALYKCEGFYGYRQDYTKWGQIYWQSWYDKNGRVLNDEGYCTVEYQYNNRGDKISEVFKGTDGNLINNAHWYARCVWKYTNNLLEEIRYYNADGTPGVRYSDMFSIVRYIRNEKGQVTQLRYYNEKEELINYDFRNPRAITRYEYDERGNQISEKYFDKEDNPSEALAGYDEIRKTYDSNGRVIKQSYYLEGVLINRSDNGIAEIVWDYDNAGRKKREAYYNKDGDPIVDTVLGYHERIIEYDGEGTVIKEEYCDENGEYISVE